MKQSTLEHPAPLHVALIMDGNGRWATARGLPRASGHRAGAATLRRIVEAAPGLGVGVVTVYAFSSDNWKRPPAEVRLLMALFGEYLEQERARCVDKGLRVSVIGRRDRLEPPLVRAIETTEAVTRPGRRLHLRIAVDYSGRDAILRAMRRLAGRPAPSREDVARLLAEYAPEGEESPDVDVLVRTGGEQRLSDFLLWECAYAELFFTPTMWPDFTPAELAGILEGYKRRERRFGGLPAAAGAR